MNKKKPPNLPLPFLRRQKHRRIAVIAGQLLPLHDEFEGMAGLNPVHITTADPFDPDEGMEGMFFFSGRLGG